MQHEWYLDEWRLLCEVEGVDAGATDGAESSVCCKATCDKYVPFTAAVFGSGWSKDGETSVNTTGAVEKDGTGAAFLVSDTVGVADTALTDLASLTGADEATGSSLG